MARTVAPDRRIAGIADRFLEAGYSLFPEAGSAAGFEKYDYDLSENTAGSHRAYLKLLHETHDALVAIPESWCSGDAWLDRRGLLAHVRMSLLREEKLGRWQNNPQVHADGAISALFDLLLRAPNNLSRVAPALLSRLKKIPAYLDAGAACIKLPVPLWTKLACTACEGAISFLEELQHDFPGAADAPVEAAFDGARAAFRRYALAVSRKPQGRPNGFSIGADSFEFLMRENLGFDISLAEAMQSGRLLIEQLQEELRREARKFGRKPVREILDAAAADWKPAGDSLLEEYRRVTETMRKKFIEKGLVTFPENDSLSVLQAPAFMRHQFPTAAYHAPGAFARKQHGIFWVNDLSMLAESPSARAKEVAQHYGIELTCAHEAYPGHHLQFVLQNRHRSRIRRIFHHSIYYEGWTLWCEKMCVDHGIYDAPHARLNQLHDALWRACRVVIDCGIHSGAMTFKQACGLLQETVQFTPARARNDLNWYTSSPTVPMSYLLGRIEVERLHAALTRQQGWSTRQFNDWILGFGAIPWSWIRRTLLNA